MNNKPSRLEEISLSTRLSWVVFACIISSVLIAVLMPTETHSTIEVILYCVVSITVLLSVLSADRALARFVCSVISIMLAAGVIAAGASAHGSALTVGILASLTVCASMSVQARAKGLQTIGRLILFVNIAVLYSLISSYVMGVSMFAVMGIIQHQISFIAVLYFTLITVAIAIGQKNVGLMGVLASTSAGGTIARRLLPVALIFPIAVGWLRVFHHREGYYEGVFGVALMGSVMALCLASFVIWTSKRIETMDAEYGETRERLRKSEEKYRKIIQNTDECFFSIDNSGKIMEWNRKASQLFGWSRNTAVGSNFLTLICPVDKRDAYERELNKLSTSGKRESKMFSFQCINKRGHRFPVEASATPIEFGDDTVVCWFVRDTSRRQEYEQALARARDQAISASEEKARFLASMSHEIRTPLNAVIGLSDLLGRSNLSEEQKQLTQVIVSSGNILLDLINSILDYSKLEAGKLELELVEFDFRDIIEGTAEIFATNAKDKGISLMTHVAPETPRKVRGDPGRIRQILMNLVDNALKFTEEGEVTIRTTIDGKEGNRAIVRVSVSDTGIGFAPDMHEQLFLPFKQAGAQISRTFGGTGLGLSICKKLIEMMGGTIGVESEPGKGSTFSFALPLEVSVEPLKYMKTDPLSGLRVMIIDGPPGSSEILRDYCQSWGMQCELVEGWGAASDRFTRNGTYDFAFVDQLAVENSWISEDTLRNQIKSQETKFVYVTSSSDLVIGEEALRMGYSACLVRPLKQSHLLDCMLRLVHDEDVYMHPKLVVEENGKREKQNLSGLILVVEDNPVNQKVALLQLRELGLSAHAVGNGREALAATEQTNYELILMDCQMPEMDGYETTRQIRKRESPEGKRTPIIAMTANAMPGDREKCLAAGMDDYIAKPVNQEKLQQVTTRWISRRGEDSGVNAIQRERENMTITVAAPAKAAIGFGTNVERGRISAIPPVELDMLEKTYGAEAREDILHSFVEEMEKLLSKVEEKFQDKDDNGLSDLFHQIKGMSSSIFAVELARLARDMELATRHGETNWEGAYAEFMRFLDTYTEARCYIRSECNVS